MKTKNALHIRVVSQRSWAEIEYVLHKYHFLYASIESKMYVIGLRRHDILQSLSLPKDNLIILLINLKCAHRRP